MYASTSYVQFVHFTYKEVYVRTYYVLPIAKMSTPCEITSNLSWVPSTWCCQGLDADSSIGNWSSLKYRFQALFSQEHFTKLVNHKNHRKKVYVEFHHFLQPRVCKYEVVVAARYQGQGIAVVGHVAYEHTKTYHSVNTDAVEPSRQPRQVQHVQHIQHASSSERRSYVFPEIFGSFFLICYLLAHSWRNHWNRSTQNLFNS